MACEAVPVIRESESPFDIVSKLYSDVVTHRGRTDTKILSEKHNVIFEMLRMYDATSVKRNLDGIGKLVNRSIPKALVSQAVTGARSINCRDMKRHADISTICKCLSTVIRDLVVRFEEGEKEITFLNGCLLEKNSEVVGMTLVWSRKDAYDRLTMYSFFEINKLQQQNGHNNGRDERNGSIRRDT